MPSACGEFFLRGGRGESCVQKPRAKSTDYPSIVHELASGWRTKLAAMSHNFHREFEHPANPSGALRYTVPIRHMLPPSWRKNGQRTVANNFAADA
jgi:hypothetical protein